MTGVIGLADPGIEPERLEPALEEPVFSQSRSMISGSSSTSMAAMQAAATAGG